MNKLTWKVTVNRPEEAFPEIDDSAGRDNLVVSDAAIKEILRNEFPYLPDVFLDAAIAGSHHVFPWAPHRDELLRYLRRKLE